MNTHIVQSPEWGEFKTKYGTPAVRVGNVQYTIHKIPLLGYKYAYCPKVNPFEIQWNDLIDSLNQNKCFAINFDVPNVLKGTEEEKLAIKEFEMQENTRVSQKNTFTKHNILLNIAKNENELLANMHKKHRYNIKYARQVGVNVRKGSWSNDFETFAKLQEKTAKRQKFLVHPKKYYRTLWEELHPKDIAHMLIAEYKTEPLAVWMVFVHNNILYYPYGGSSEKFKNFYASNLIGWEAIRFGQQKGCEMFDMWGACADLYNKEDPDWGFTNFKIKFGGSHVEYMSSFDLILNESAYKVFNFTYPTALKILRKFK